MFRNKKENKKLEIALRNACEELAYYQRSYYDLSKQIYELGQWHSVPKDIQGRSASEWYRLLKEQI